MAITPIFSLLLGGAKIFLNPTVTAIRQLLRLVFELPLILAERNFLFLATSSFFRALIELTFLKTNGLPSLVA